MAARFRKGTEEYNARVTKAKAKFDEKYSKAKDSVATKAFTPGATPSVPTAAEPSPAAAAPKPSIDDHM